MHILTIEPIGQDKDQLTLLFRLEHVYEPSEHSTLSKSISVDINVSNDHSLRLKRGFSSKLLFLCRRSSVTTRFTKPKKWPWVEICTKVNLSNDWNGQWILPMVSQQIPCTNRFTRCHHHHLSLRSKKRIGPIDSLRWENRRTASDANTLVFCEVKQTLNTRSINGAEVNY